jgi:signal transduction histidine kinase
MSDPPSLRRFDAPRPPDGASSDGASDGDRRAASDASRPQTSATPPGLATAATPSVVPAPPARGPVPLVSRLRVGQWFAVSGALLGVVVVVCVVVGALAVAHLAHARDQVVTRLDPAQTAALRLSNALVNQETGVRGFTLTGRPQFLDPYTTGRREQLASTHQLRQLTGELDATNIAADLDRVERLAGDWQRGYAVPAIAATRRGTDAGAAAGAAGALSADEGKARFDRLRAGFSLLERDITAARRDGRSKLTSAARFLTIAFAAILAALAAAALSGAILLRRIVSRPMRRLSDETRVVARGDFDHVVSGTGARDIVELGEDIGSMRRRIVRELGSLREANERLNDQALDLRRSNAELEQFAYVASHDLQEPLRKVASFTQLLQRRYGNQLDDRADQYIEFAVDGAKRMQQLINDLLAFSRVGRVGGEATVVSLRRAVDDALANLAGALDEAHATVRVGELPDVRGEPALLAAVFQNLVGNAVKFRGEEPPVVRVTAHRHPEAWEFAVADNGIGIDAAYADRIFVIFQRLHPKDAYAGTGIGLAMCRKIVEYHGGRIWLDTDSRAGTTFRFTLPLLEETT